MVKRLFHLAVVFLLAGLAFGQQPDTYQDQTRVEPMDHTPVYRVKVVSRSAEAVNYQHHSGKTSLDFRGTNLMPDARGRATVESRTGRIEINTELEHLQSPRSFGPEYLTYVLWAITPEGRASNLGEVPVFDDGKSSVKVTTDLQAFGLIVTAEPYFAVTRPSNLVVLENVVRKNTKGWEEPIDTKFDAVERGQYTVDVNVADLPATSADHSAPVDLLEARNAVAIARAEGADRYAPDSFSKAEDFLRRAEDYSNRKQSDKAIATVARGAVQSAEDARVLSIRKRQEERQEAERRATEQRAIEAQNQAEQAQQSAEQAKAQADDEARQRAEAERDRRAAERAKTEAEQARQQAEAARADALAQQQAAQSQALQAQQTAQQAEQARQQTEQQAQETRERLLQQLNQVLQTRESARGLIVDMPDVLFDTGQHTLKVGARERLAKVAGILLAYPDLHVNVEGHTDNVGGLEFNQRLSEERANAVRAFLVEQGVRLENIESHGVGMSEPVASNSTREGRQMNRRVDLVVSGQSIGTTGALRHPETPASEPGVNDRYPAGTQPTTPNTSTQPATQPRMPQRR
ncbi:MAG: flagellar motor protein MotB [Acidobacteria bacterium]|nr:MAG: flagellar motor protein MotB [Acidobacteriota bacterium]PYX44766.1 MAG: flagellar motor protein MotB [Acidobacteriota bacterium]